MPSAAPVLDTTDLAARAGEAAKLLKLLANENRMLVLCELAKGEASVSALSQTVGLSQSALSQHLAKMRAEGLVAYRREAQTLYYRIENPDAERVLAVLKEVFCPADGETPKA